jgi:hypothetical protein
MEFIRGREIVLGKFTMVLHDRYKAEYSHQTFNTLKELAIALINFDRHQVAIERYHGFVVCYDELMLFSENGKSLNTKEIHAYGKKFFTPYRYWRVPPYAMEMRGYIRRRTPVPGVHKYAHGHYFRRIHTTAELRLNQFVDPEEPQARASRTGYNLPNSWDDYPKTVERSWKSQHKGRKAWDRR